MMFLIGTQSEEGSHMKLRLSIPSTDAVSPAEVLQHFVLLTCVNCASPEWLIWMLAVELEK